MAFAHCGRDSIVCECARVDCLPVFIHKLRLMLIRISFEDITLKSCETSPCCTCSDSSWSCRDSRWSYVNDQNFTTSGIIQLGLERDIIHNVWISSLRCRNHFTTGGHAVVLSHHQRVHRRTTASTKRRLASILRSNHTGKARSKR